MNGVDVALVVVFAGCALRGWWRGFFRECFGLLGLVVGIAAAVRLTAVGDAALQQHLRLPVPVGAGVAFVAIFVAVHGLINVVGFLLSRLTHTVAQSTLDGIGGALLGATKGAVAVSFVLLFLHLFPISATIDPRLMGSSLGRPLVGVASSAIRISPQPDSADRS